MLKGVLNLNILFYLLLHILARVLLYIALTAVAIFGKMMTRILQALF
jgi:hypothetical protein